MGHPRYWVLKMPFFYPNEDVRTGEHAKQHGHVVHIDARYQPMNMRVVFKENKNHNADLSVLEVAFSELAHLFIDRELTAKQVLVRTTELDVVGVACENITYMIERHESYQGDYFSSDLKPFNNKDTKTIPYYFFNTLPSSFFGSLLKKADKQEVSLDLASLASILTTSYTLEEDDLHKGNFGVYFVKKDNKPHAVFFKIDHDLMLSDSIMSHYHTRLFNWLHGQGAFEVTARDLIGFPNLMDSQNFYWPTRRQLIHGGGNKAFTSAGEREAFRSLARSATFCKYKWQSFYKHILVPDELIVKSLAKHLDKQDPKDRARIAAITHAVLVRQARLRAVLFSIKEFREAVTAMDEDDKRRIISSIVKNAGRYPLAERMRIEGELEQTVAFYQASQGSISKEDSPLHVAIKFGDYRYVETIEACKSYLNKKNAEGKTPLDVAVEMALAQIEPAPDVRQDYRSIINHLIHSGAKKTKAYQDYVSKNRSSPSQEFDSGYPDKMICYKQPADIIELFYQLGADHRYSLKMQKQIALRMVGRLVEDNQRNQSHLTVLKQLKVALDTNAPCLQFVKQLRSHLWIVRVFRGFLGGTKTNVLLNAVLTKEIKRCQPRVSAVFFKREHDVTDNSSLVRQPGSGIGH